MDEYPYHDNYHHGGGGGGFHNHHNTNHYHQQRHSQQRSSQQRHSQQYHGHGHGHHHQETNHNNAYHHNDVERLRLDNKQMRAMLHSDTQERLYTMTDAVKTVLDSPTCKDLSQEQRTNVDNALSQISGLEFAMLDLLNSMRLRMINVLEDFQKQVGELKKHRETANAAADSGMWLQERMASGHTAVNPVAVEEDDSVPNLSTNTTDQLKALRKMANVIAPLATTLEQITPDVELFAVRREFESAFHSLHQESDDSIVALTGACKELAVLTQEHAKKPLMVVRDEAARAATDAEKEVQRIADQGEMFGTHASLVETIQNINKYLMQSKLPPLPRPQTPVPQGNPRLSGRVSTGGGPGRGSTSLPPRGSQRPPSQSQQQQPSQPLVEVVQELPPSPQAATKARVAAYREQQFAAHSKRTRDTREGEEDTTMMMEREDTVEDFIPPPPSPAEIDGSVKPRPSVGRSQQQQTTQQGRRPQVPQPSQTSSGGNARHSGSQQQFSQPQWEGREGSRPVVGGGAAASAHPKPIASSQQQQQQQPRIPANKVPPKEDKNKKGGADDDEDMLPAKRRNLTNLFGLF